MQQLGLNRFVFLDQAVVLQRNDNELLLVQEEHGLAYMFISHDLRIVRALSDDLVVLRQGRVVEQGRADNVFGSPREPYTQALLKAAFDLEADESADMAQ